VKSQPGIAGKNEPQPLSAALSQLIAMRGLARAGGDAQLTEIWKSLAGPKIAGATRVLNIHRGVLHVAVTNAPLLSELASFHKSSLLAALTEEYPHLRIRDLKFRLRGDLAS
jgi:hypothetical protein